MERTIDQLTKKQAGGGLLSGRYASLPGRSRPGGATASPSSADAPAVRCAAGRRPARSAGHSGSEKQTGQASDGPSITAKASATASKYVVLSGSLSQMRRSFGVSAPSSENRSASAAASSYLLANSWRRSTAIS